MQEQKFNKPDRIKLLATKPKIILGTKLIEQIETAHLKVKKDTEWSGILVYSIKEGSLEKLSELVLYAEGFYLANIGSSTYTDYEPSDHMEGLEETFDLIGASLAGKPKYMGQIHTHHSLGGGAFFSATDTTDLQENAQGFSHFMYVSLIVSYQQVSNWKCKGAIPYTESKSEVIMNHESGLEIVLEEAKEEQVVAVCEFTIELEIDKKKLCPKTVKRVEEETAKLEELAKKAELTKTVNHMGYPVKNSYGGYSPRGLVKSPNSFNLPKKKEERTNEQVEQEFLSRKKERLNEAKWLLICILKQFVSEHVKLDIKSIQTYDLKIFSLFEEIDSDYTVTYQKLKNNIIQNWESYYDLFVVDTTEFAQMNQAIIIVDIITVLTSFEEDCKKAAYLIKIFDLVKANLTKVFKEFIKSDTIYIEDVIKEK